MQIKASIYSTMIKTVVTMVMLLSHSDNTDTASQAAIVHRATQTPLIFFGVKNFDRLQIGGAC